MPERMTDGVTNAMPGRPARMEAAMTPTAVTPKSAMATPAAVPPSTTSTAVGRGSRKQPDCANHSEEQHKRNSGRNLHGRHLLHRVQLTPDRRVFPGLAICPGGPKKAKQNAADLKELAKANGVHSPARRPHEKQNFG
jgi:hypothetical protein